VIRKIKQCRLCEGELFSDRLTLSPTPLANELYDTRKEAEKAEVFPLTLAMCSVCSHVQLVDLVSSLRLFENYAYQSGTSSFFRKHFEEFAFTTSQFVVNTPVLEIGSNDGTLLSAYQRLGIRSIGIEPSAQLVSGCLTLGLDARVGYFDKKTRDDLIAEYGLFDLIVANNVLAHIDDLRQVFIDIYSSLSNEGVCVFEVAHLLSMVEQGTFDSIYHEHMSYHSIYSLEKFCNSVGLTIFKVEQVNSHGGSVRVFVSKNPEVDVQISVKNLIYDEIVAGLDKPGILKVIRDQINNLKGEVAEIFSSDLENESKITFGYGAPAKLVTFISETQLYKVNIQFIVDDNPLKQGKFVPKWSIPIVSQLEAQQGFIKLLKEFHGLKIRVVIFPWNLSEELIDKLTTWLPRGTEVVWFNKGLNVREIS
jgi:2-polyprenyl-3-methyl-5-hydroxy-6-metoxy-1,4-benzoquinol methylase